MDISKYTLEDWLLWGVLPEDLKIENEDLSYTEYPERGVETKGTYSLGYMDWYNGAIQSDEVDSLYDKNELGITSYIAITSLQSLAYLKMLTNELWHRSNPIKDIFRHSLMKRDMLAEEIEKVKLELQEIKKNYPEVYANALKGVDERNKLSSSEVVDTLSSERYYYMDTNTAFEVIVKAKYLNWLTWFNDPDSDKLPEPTFIEDAKPHIHELLHISGQLSEYKENAEPYWYTLQRQAGFNIPVKAKHKSEPNHNTNARELLPKNNKSYTWLSNDEDLPKLCKALIDKELIHKDTTLEQFEAVFAAKPLQEIEPKPIKWHEDNASELLHFIQQLQGSNEWPNGWLIEKEERANYKRLTTCFVKPNGEQFNPETLRQTKQNLKQFGLAPAKQQIIDSVLIKLK